MICPARDSCPLIAGKDTGDMHKANCMPGGFGPMARMEQWNRDNPAEFKMYHRSLVVNTFSGMERFGAVVCAKLERMGTIQMVLRCTCYNLIAWTNMPAACVLPSASCMPESRGYGH